MTVDSSGVFSKLVGPCGLPIAGFSTASLLLFAFALPGGFHFANRPLMVAGLLFFIACGLHVWRHRDQSEATYVGERVSLSTRFLRLPWTSLFSSFFCFFVAATFALVLLMASAKAQEKGEPISLHVKEMHRTQEDTDYGTVYHITAVVESKTVVYSIKCDESYLSKGGYNARCAPLSAGKDYSARKFENAINFWQPEDHNKGYLLALYEIVGEKEK